MLAVLACPGVFLWWPLLPLAVLFCLCARVLLAEPTRVPTSVIVFFLLSSSACYFSFFLCYFVSLVRSILDSSS